MNVYNYNAVSLNSNVISIRFIKKFEVSFLQGQNKFFNWSGQLSSSFRNIKLKSISITKK